MVFIALMLQSKRSLAHLKFFAVRIFFADIVNFLFQIDRH